jgi:16S rRNA (cytosine1402-N4)-methyltransferase
METNAVYHIPVLLQESIEGLNIRRDGTYADLTFGAGGHSREILNRLGEKGRLFGFDQDEDAEKNSFNDPRFTFVKSNFRFLGNFMDWYGIDRLDGILADLGVSWHHFDDETRGFSFRFDGDLDMRMNRNGGKTAADVLNTYSEQQLADVFYHFGELHCARGLARATVKFRETGKIRTTSDFLTIIKPFFSREKEKKSLAQAFQAIRIEVNNEMLALGEMLLAAGSLLAEGGRMVVITYHSLEDRMVKNFFRSGNLEGKVEKDFYGNVKTPFRLINNKVIVPSEEEQEKNPRSRSAKLRIIEKYGDNI